MRLAVTPANEMVMAILLGLAGQLAANGLFGVDLAHDAEYGAMLGLVIFLWGDLKRRAKAESDADARLSELQRRLEELASAPGKVESIRPSDPA